MSFVLRSPRLWIFVLCLLPLLRLIVLGMDGGLGANPIEFITRSTGTWTLVGLLVTLSVTPLRRLTGRAALLRYRRMLGLFAFFYACLHFATYLWLDQFFELAAIAKDIVKRPFITVGFAAFVLLIPLAVTSNQAMMRRLGRRWQLLHRMVYPIAVLGVVHYLWLVKKDITQPLIYGGVLGFARCPPAVGCQAAAGGIQTFYVSQTLGEETRDAVNRLAKWTCTRGPRTTGPKQAALAGSLFASRSGARSRSRPFYPPFFNRPRNLKW